MPNRRQSETIKGRVGGMSVFVTLGYFEDGSLGEIFIDASREGTQVREMMHALARMVSLGLQSGISIESIIKILGDTETDSIPAYVSKLLRG